MKEIDEKYFKEPISQNTVEDILEEDEKILKRTKPDKRAYILSSAFKMLPLALFWLAFDAAFLTLIGKAMSNGEMPLGMLGFIVPFFIVHLVPVWLWIAKIVRSVLEIKNIEYVFTDKRIIIRSGVIVDFKFLYYDKIESVNAKVGLLDRLCKVGDVYVTAAGTKAVIFDQSDPYTLATQLQRVANDVKADVMYPNALRPSVNPGYATKYAGNMREETAQTSTETAVNETKTAPQTDETAVGGAPSNGEETEGQTAETKTMSQNSTPADETSKDGEQQ